MENSPISSRAPLPSSLGKGDIAYNLSCSPASVQSTPSLGYSPGTTFALAPPASSASAPRPIQTSPIQSPSISPTSLHLLHPIAAEVLQRTETQSAWDVESYVRALGNKKYAAVKETRRQALLRRAREESGSTALDEATIRKQTNLASAEASRAKKEFILDELYAQLKKKNDDSITLAKELRRVLLMLEHAHTTRQVEIPLLYLQQQHQQNQHQQQQPQQPQHQQPSAFVAQMSHANTPVTSHANQATNDHDSNMFNEENTKMEASAIPQTHGDLDKSVYSMMDTDENQHQSNYIIDDHTTVSATGFETGHCPINLINFASDSNMKVGEIVYQGSLDNNDMMDEKSHGVNGNMSVMQNRLYQLSDGNHNDNYANTG